MRRKNPRRTPVRIASQAAICRASRWALSIVSKGSAFQTKRARLGGLFFLHGERDQRRCALVDAQTVASRRSRSNCKAPRDSKSLDFESASSERNGGRTRAHSG